MYSLKQSSLHWIVIANNLTTALVVLWLVCLPLSFVDHRFDQVKLKTIKVVCVASPRSMQHYNFYLLPKSLALTNFLFILTIQYKSKNSFSQWLWDLELTSHSSQYLWEFYWPESKLTKSDINWKKVMKSIMISHVYSLE